MGGSEMKIKNLFFWILSLGAILSLLVYNLCARHQHNRIEETAKKVEMFVGQMAAASNLTVRAYAGKGFIMVRGRLKHTNDLIYLERELPSLGKSILWNVQIDPE